MVFTSGSLSPIEDLVKELGFNLDPSKLEINDDFFH